MTVTLSVAVMHAAFDPHRNDYLSGLLRSLGESHQAVLRDAHDFAVISDNDRLGPWPTARAAWQWSLRTGATHHLLLQDDVIVCDGFLTMAKEALAAVPREMVSFFTTRPGYAKRAVSRNHHWLRSNAEVFGQAICMPDDVLADFLRWERSHIKPTYKHDDARVGYYAIARDRPIYFTLPSLVQHVGLEHSTLGHSVPAHQKVLHSPWFSKEVGSVDWTEGVEDSLYEPTPRLYRIMYGRHVI